MKCKECEYNAKACPPNCKECKCFKCGSAGCGNAVYKGAEIERPNFKPKSPSQDKGVPFDV